MVVAENADWVEDLDLERVVMGWELAGGAVEVDCGIGGPVELGWAGGCGPGPGTVEWAAGVGPVCVWATGGLGRRL